MKKILVTNDDGFDSNGLKALVEALKPLGEVTVVAPTTEKSACGHSLTLTRPLRLIELDDNFFKLDDGTPTDCVYLALYALFKEESKPDLVVSGINRGSNMGEDITYSGTASAAMEAVLQGIPAVAFSQIYENSPASLDNFDYSLAKKVVYEICNKILQKGMPLDKREFINVNIPFQKEFKGYKITKLGHKMYSNNAHLHRNPRGEEYYWIGTHILDYIPLGDKSCDLSAIDEGFVSVTPVKLDLTANEKLKNLETWIDG